MKRNKILAILGPTAVGKTDLTLNLAGRFSAEIISCDSVQLYQYLDIGSAKPGPDLLVQVPHHLISVFSPDFRINAGIYKQHAETAISSCIDRGILPVLSGGTGMYFNALYYGMFSSQSSDAEVKKSLIDRAEKEGLDTLYEELIRLDPDCRETVMPRDRQRIIRCLEVLTVCGQPLREMQKNNDKLDLDWYLIGLDRDRQELYQRIELRVDQMLDSGLIRETAALSEQFGKDAYALGSIGYRHVLKYLAGEWDQETMVSELKKDTRHYAKRQLTWFRKNPDIHWYHPDDMDRILQDVQGFLT